MKLTREQVIALAKYEMELYEKERELPSADDQYRNDSFPYKYAERS
jgi:hypothetical protein